MRQAIRWQSSQTLAFQTKAFSVSIRLWPASQSHFLFPLWNIPDYSKGSLNWMQKLIKHEMCKLHVKHSKSDLQIFGEKWKSGIRVWKQSFWQRNELMAPQKPFKHSFQRSTTVWVQLPPRFCSQNTQEKSCGGTERRARPGINLSKNSRNSVQGTLVP